MQNCSGDAIYIGTGDYIKLVNCILRNNGRFGITGDNGVSLVNCIVEGNGSSGMDVDNSGHYIGNIFRNNGFYQLDGNSASYLYKNLVYGHTSGSVPAARVNSSSIFIGNTIDAENGLYGFDGLNSSIIVVDNIVYKASYSTQGPTTAWEITGTYANNHFIEPVTAEFLNTLPYTPYNHQNASGDPWVDRAGEDYNLSGSAASVDAGMMPGNWS